MERLIINHLTKSHYPNDRDVKKLLAYISGRGKRSNTDKVLSVKAFGASKMHKEAAFQFLKVQKYYNKTSGRRCYHFIVSFPGEFTCIDAVQQSAANIAQKVFYQRGFQVFYAIHLDTDNLHIHFAVNSVNLHTGKKLHISRNKLFTMKQEILECVNVVLYDHGLRIFKL